MGREESKPSLKRVRELTPPLKERERWGPSSGSRDRRYGSPGPVWQDEGERGDRGRVARIDRERERTRSPVRRYERDEPPRTVVPAVLNWFVSQLPPPNSFDGEFFS